MADQTVKGNPGGGISFVMASLRFDMARIYSMVWFVKVSIIKVVMAVNTGVAAGTGKIIQIRRATGTIHQKGLAGMAHRT